MHSCRAHQGSLEDFAFKINHCFIACLLSISYRTHGLSHCMTRHVSVAGSNAHTVAVLSGSTTFPLALRQGSGERDQSKARHLKPDFEAVRSPGSARIDRSWKILCSVGVRSSGVLHNNPFPTSSMDNAHGSC
jgi:hypothetical protein